MREVGREKNALEGFRPEEKKDRWVQVTGDVLPASGGEW